MNVQPFGIAVPQSTLDDLRRRLEATRWPQQIAGEPWALGADLAFMRELVEHWRTQFDWPAQQRRLNRFRHFHAEVDGQPIHFIHQRGHCANPLPIVITHGWPGSFVEMVELLPLLEDGFDVVVPSIPGFGFSSAPRAAGCGPERVAHLWKQLMEGLGYSRFAVQGGDFGAAVSTWIALHYPESVVGIHLNYIPGSYMPYLATPLSEAEEKFKRDAAAWVDEEGGYWRLQGTRPHTPAFALTDSPAGLAAWIVEKFWLWGGRRFTNDELLTNVMIYWIAGTIGSSMRFYVESRRRPLVFERDMRVMPPCAVARFPQEAPFPPREWVERGYNVARWTEMPRGGHFAALEEPELLAADLREFF